MWTEENERAAHVELERVERDFGLCALQVFARMTRPGRMSTVVVCADGVALLSKAAEQVKAAGELWAELVAERPTSSPHQAIHEGVHEKTDPLLAASNGGPMNAPGGETWVCGCGRVVGREEKPCPDDGRKPVICYVTSLRIGKNGKATHATRSFSEVPGGFKLTSAEEIFAPLERGSR